MELRYILTFLITIFSFSPYSHTHASNSNDKNEYIKQIIEGRIIIDYKILINKLNINELDVPLNKFIAYYFDLSDLNVIKHKEIVDYPAAHIAHHPFHGIEGSNFGAYWVGNFTYKEETVINLNIKYSDAQQIIIDGVALLKNENLNNTIQITLQEGKHKIEICLLSRYSFPSFLATFTIDNNNTDIDFIRKQLFSIENSVVWYCGVHASENSDFSININLRESNNPIILFLASQDAVIWRLNDVDKSNVRAIVLSSNSPGSIVSNAPSEIKIIRYNNIPIQHNITKNPTNLGISIENITGKKLNGFSGSMISKSFFVPDIYIDREMNSYSSVNFDKIVKINKNIGITNCNKNNKTDNARITCIRSILQYTDNRLNLCYNELKNLLEPAYDKFWERKREPRTGELESLISSQRLWIKTRNSLCGIKNETQQNKYWLNYVAGSTTLSNCILEETENRLSKLEAEKLDIIKPLQQVAD